jgi:DNA-binding transcriptional MerR regulator
MSNASDPVQEFFSIGEVCDLTGLKAHVLRYWESQFRFLSPAKNRSGNRVYQRKAGELRRVSRDALAVEALESIEQDLRDLLRQLESASEKR